MGLHVVSACKLPPAWDSICLPSTEIFTLFEAKILILAPLPIARQLLMYVATFLTLVRNDEYV